MSQSLLDILWVLFCSSLVFLMQAGFTCLESGLTRSKNSINVAIKNLVDITISVLLFWAFGYGLMFGLTQAGWIGSSDFLLSPETAPQRVVFFIFQAMFCSTATTILSGAIAERVNFAGYAIMVVLLSGLIYPIFGHWAWNGLADGTHTGWLGAWGFVDFAGSTVVHSVGGWVSLATVLIIGPRTGRFSAEGEPKKIPGSNLPLSVLGVFLLWFGWLGFNGGSTFSLNEKIPAIILNTILAASAGSVAVLLFNWGTDGRYQVELLMNGVLAGLVAITAAAHIVSPLSAIVIGAIGGLVMIKADHLLEKFRIDDVVGAIPVHLAAGIWGTLAVALFGNLTLMGTGLTRLEQIGVQVAGIVVCGIWAFGLGYLLIKTIDRYRPLRVSLEDEQVGLNVSEHDAATEILDFLQALQYQADTGDIHLRVHVEPFTEIGQIARMYNKVLDALQKAVMTTEAIVRDIQDGVVTLSRDGLLTSFNPGAELIFGLSAAEAIGQPFSKLIASTNGTNGTSSNYSEPVSFLKFMNNRQETVGLRPDHSTFPLEVVVSEGNIGEEPLYTGIFRDITERKKTEEQLQRLMAAVEQSANTIVITNLEGYIEYANPSFERTTGYTLEEAKGVHTRVLKSGKTSQEEYKDLWETIISGGIWHGEFSNKKKNGEHYWESASISPIRNTKGEITHFLAVKEDITERKKIENALQEQVKRMRALYEVFSSPGLSFEQQIEAVLRVGCELLGTEVGIVSQVDETDNVYKVKHIVTRVATGIEKEQIFKFDQTFCYLTFAKGDAVAISHIGQSQWREHPCYHNTKLESFIGTPIQINGQHYGTVNFSGIKPKEPPFEEVDQDFVHLMANWISATLEQQRAEKALQESEAHLRQVLSSVSVHIYMTEFTHDGQVVNGYISPNVEEMTGYPQERFLSDWSFWPRQVIHPDDRVAAAEQAELLLSGEQSEMEYRLVRSDGRIIWVRDSAQVENRLDSNHRFIYGVVSDITHQKEAEQALIEAHERVSETSRLKSELLANVSHDLRTPLGVINGYTEMLHLGVYGPISEKQKDITSNIMDSTGQLLHFVTNLLDQARIESGQVVVKSESFSPEELAEAVYFSTKMLAAAKEIDLSYTLDSHLSPEIAGDAYWLRQILINLVSNAIKFTPQGGSVSYKLYKSDDSYWTIQVSDTGIGIPPEAKDYIFEPFRQVDGSATRGNLGSGLGLSIVSQLTQLMGGRLELQSEQGSGSTFTIILPLTVVQKETL
ncbi:MAG: ammonium transporter [Anaerolineae bacterium]|nr:ammonium transporter [Anaerolineae bacterium]